MRNGFAGTVHLLRLILRLDRIKLPLWLLGLSFLIVVTPLSIRSVIEAEAEAENSTTELVLAEQAVLMETNTAMLAIQGPPESLDTFGGRYAFEMGAFTFVMVGLMNIMLVARHTRAEEESGRAELVRAAAVGPWSSLAAVSIVALLANLVLVGITTAVFTGDGLDLGRSLLFGLSLGSFGLVFAATTLIWVQIFEYGRAAVGVALAALGAAFAFRAVGDMRDSLIWSVSPMGWAQRLNAFGDPRLWTLGLSLGATVICVIIAIGLVLRRDVGAGLIDQRPGPPVASPSLVSPLGLAWRLQRSVLFWWLVGLAAFGAVYGSVISSIDDLLDESESMRDVFEEMGVSLDAIRDGFLTIVLTMIGLVAAAAVIQSVLRPRSEETLGRVDPILGGSVSRRSWLGSHVLLAAIAAPVLMAAASVSLVLVDALVTGELVGLGDAVVAGLARTPALWAIAAVGVLLYGWAEGFSLGVWAVFAGAAVVFMFGEVLQLPDFVLNLSPLGHVSHLPGGTQGWTSLIVLTLIAAASTGAGLRLFERRDLG